MHKPLNEPLTRRRASTVPYRPAVARVGTGHRVQRVADLRGDLITRGDRPRQPVPVLCQCCKWRTGIPQRVADGPAVRAAGTGHPYQLIGGRRADIGTPHYRPPGAVPPFRQRLVGAAGAAGVQASHRPTVGRRRGRRCRSRRRPLRSPRPLWWSPTSFHSNERRPA